MAASSNNGLPYESRSMLFKALHNLIEKSLIEKGYARLGKWFVMPYDTEVEKHEFDVDLTEVNETGDDGDQSKVAPDHFNHVSYSFSFFLHGASRVCTSVDMKLHKPIRVVNTDDLFTLKSRMKKSFSTKPSRLAFAGLDVILAPNGVSARLLGYLPNVSIESKLTCVEWQQFYSLKLHPNLPKVLVVDIENNTV